MPLTSHSLVAQTACQDLVRLHHEEAASGFTGSI